MKPSSSVASAGDHKIFFNVAKSPPRREKCARWEGIVSDSSQLPPDNGREGGKGGGEEALTVETHRDRLYRPGASATEYEQAALADATEQKCQPKTEIKLL